MNPATRVAPANAYDAGPPSPVPRRADRWEGASSREPERRRGPWGAIAAVVAVLVVLGIIAWVLVANTSTSAPPPPAASPTTTTTTTAAPTTTTRASRTTTATSSASGNTVPVSNIDYVGRPASVAVAALREDGLDTDVRTVLGSKPNDPSACRVLYVSPTGDVRRGDTVTVTCQEFG